LNWKELQTMWGLGGLATDIGFYQQLHTAEGSGEIF